VLQSYSEGVSSKDVDRALAAPIGEVGPKLLSLPEGQWFDRKSVRSDVKSLAPVLVALANADGGVVVIGLHDGIVEGIKSNPGRINDYRQAAIDHTVPPVRCTVDQVGCVNSRGETDSLIVLRVDPGEVVHETKSGDCYLRIGDESRKLDHSLRQELAFDRGQGHYDGQPADGVRVGDLDELLLRQFRDATGAKGSFTRLLQARSLLTRQGDVTNAGYLLFAPDPGNLFPQAHIRVIRYLSSQRGSGSRLMVDAEHDVRVEGPIPRQIEEAARVIERLIPKRRALKASGLFEDEQIVPRDAWLEGVVNAVIHRSYSLGGDHIRVEIFPDRVEVESPGRFPGLADLRKPLEIGRFARNPRVARVCADLRIGQELGEGIRRIFDEMRRVGLTDPVYRQTQSSVRLTLAAVARLDPSVASRLPSRSQDVLDLLRATAAELGTGEIGEALGMSRPTVMKRLKALQEEGLVLWVGKSARDPRAVWKLE
jgi:ATP-dependent DNA helicase RecG